MKKELRFWVPFILSVNLLSSCVYDKEFAYLNDQIIALNRRVTKIEESQATVDKKVSHDLDVRIQSIRAGNAETVSDMERLRTEIKELSGRIEDNDQVVKRVVERDIGDQDAMKQSLAQLTKKVDELEGMARRQQEYLGLKTLPPAAEKVEGEPPGTAEPSPEKTPAPAPAVAESSEASLYDGALASFRSGKFEDGMEGFEEFLKKYPKSDRADNAQFWIGECYMSLKHYEQAILAYQKVIKNYPKGNKAPNAMLRQAMAFLEIKDQTSTKLLLRKIIKNYPKSNEAKIAEKKLKTLK
ncbi:MAG: tol-pal system protein YbgF [Pseudomonadota bacterium]